MTDLSPASLDSALTDAQVQQFVEHGYVVLHDCFSRGAAQEYVATTYHALGYDPEDRTTWKQSLLIGLAGPDARIRDFSPKLWAAICQLLGGEDRIANTDASLAWISGTLALILSFFIQARRKSKMRFRLSSGNRPISGK